MFVGCLLGMERVPIGPQLASPVGPPLDMVWIHGLNWAWGSDCLLGMECVLIGPQLPCPVGPPLDMVWICGLNWACISGLFTGYGLGPNWPPANKPSWAPFWI